jgi:6-phosphofructokinase 1
LGYEAVNILSMKEKPCIVGLDGYRVSKIPMMEAIENTRKIPKFVASKEFESLDILKVLQLPQAIPINLTEKQKTIAVMNVGATAPGMNSAVRTVTRLSINHGIKVLGVHKGFDGLFKGEINELRWNSVNGWSPIGGTFLGTSRTVPDAKKFATIANVIKQFKIDAIVIIGGFEGYSTAYNLQQASKLFESLAIPFVLVPATISNNLPSTEASIGMDKAMYNLMSSTDQIKQSAIGYARRVFIVECMGKQCGCQSVFGAIISGAEGCYIAERGLSLSDLQNDLNKLSRRFSHNNKIALYINSEGSSSTYSTKVITKLFAAETPKGVSVRSSILGNLQQGGNPTPLDRQRAVRMAAAAVDFICFNHFGVKNEKEWNNLSFNSAMIGLDRDQIIFTDLNKFPDLVDEKNRRPIDQWWLELLKVAEIVGQENANPKL